MRFVHHAFWNRAGITDGRWNRSIKYERSQKAASLGGDRSATSGGRGSSKRPTTGRPNVWANRPSTPSSAAFTPNLSMNAYASTKSSTGWSPASLTREKHIVVYLTSVLNETPHCASGARHKLRIDGVDDQLVKRVLAGPFAPNTGDERLDAIRAVHRHFDALTWRHK